MGGLADETTKRHWAMDFAEGMSTASDDCSSQYNVERQSRSARRQYPRSQWTGHRRTHGVIVSARSAGISVSIRACCSWSAGAYRRRDERPRAARRRAVVPAAHDPTGSCVALSAGRSERHVEGRSSGQRSSSSSATGCTCFSGHLAGRGVRPLARSAMGAVFCPTISASISTPHSSTICRGNWRLRERRTTCKFSEAYVIAHEVGHHVQATRHSAARAQEPAGFRQQGAAKRTARYARSSCRPRAAWPRHLGRSRAAKARFPRSGRHRSGAAGRASAIGDGACKKRRKAMSVPDAFTHGTSEQRKRWFMRGLKEGDIAACNTFAANPL